MTPRTRVAAPQTRRPAAERRDEIGRAVLRIIGERGIQCLTTAALAREVGLTSGALFRHFASLDEMLDEAVRIALAMIETTYPDKSNSAVERLFALAQDRIALLRSEPGVAWLLRSEQARSTLSADAAKELGSGIDRSKRYLLAAIRESAEQGSIRNDIPPEVLLITVVGTIQALCGLPSAHEPSRRRRRVAVDGVLAALRKLLAPVRTAGDSPGELT